MPSLFTRNRPAGQPAPGSGPFQRIPQPGGATAQEQSAVYTGFYGEMPMPATQFATSTARIKEYNVVPSVRSVMANASFVDRHDRLNGIISTGGRQLRNLPGPQHNNPVFSSDFNKHLIGPQVNYILNACLYRAGYPAATISFGTMRNLALSERTPQLPTRVTGGPGPAAMLASPRYVAVQEVPRYSTMPQMYPTQSQPG